jgi:glutamate formiminotransferase
MIVRRYCALTRQVEEMEIPVTLERLDDWQQNRRLVKEAFPDLTADQREFLLSGIKPEKWKEIFGNDEVEA